MSGVIKYNATVADRQFAKRYGDVLREVSRRLDPLSGDPEGSVIGQAAGRIMDAMQIVATQSDAHLTMATIIARALPPDDEEYGFMESPLGQDLLRVRHDDLFVPDWRASTLAEAILRQYN